MNKYLVYTEFKWYAVTDVCLIHTHMESLDLHNEYYNEHNEKQSDKMKKRMK